MASAAVTGCGPGRACARLRQLTCAMLKDYPRLKRWEETDDVFQNASLRLYRALGKVRPASVREFFRLAAVQIRRELIDRSSNCPHGRPTTLRLSLRDLEKQFKRTGF